MLDDRLRASLAAQFLVQRGFTAFAALATVLALVGVFGLLAWNVSSRRHDIAVRLALGATPASVARSSSRQAVALLGWGIGMGAPAGWMISRAVAAFVPGFAPLDAATAGLTIAVFSTAALLLCIEPGRRAAATDLGILNRS
jgi:ABC-type antimicrobial peptide transport system permease subunit